MQSTLATVYERMGNTWYGIRKLAFQKDLEI